MWFLGSIFIHLGHTETSSFLGFREPGCGALGLCPALLLKGSAWHCCQTLQHPQPERQRGSCSSGHCCATTTKPSGLKPLSFYYIMIFTSEKLRQTWLEKLCPMWHWLCSLSVHFVADLPRRPEMTSLMGLMPGPPEGRWHRCLRTDYLRNYLGLLHIRALSE